MKTQNLILYRIPYEHPAWMRFRTTGLTKDDCGLFNCPKYAGGIGGSEVGSILGLSEWRPVAAEYYHFKIGTHEPQRFDNEAMLMGRILEPIIKDLWCAYDGTDSGWVENYANWSSAAPKEKSQHQIRKARRVNAYVVNRKYPYLFASLDFYTENNTPSILDGSVYSDGFPLEIKTINGLYANQWLNEIPQYHIAQVNLQMIVTETDYAEIALLVDGRKLRVLPVRRDNELCKRIISVAEVFWQKVMEGRLSKIKMDKAFAENNIDEYERHLAIIDSNEPDPDNSRAYNDYIKEKFKHITPITEGSIDQYELCLEDMSYQLYIKALNSKRMYIENLLLTALTENAAEVIDFGALGNFSFKADKNGNRSKRYNLKVKPSIIQAEKEIEQLPKRLL